FPEIGQVAGICLNRVLRELPLECTKSKKIAYRLGQLHLPSPDTRNSDIAALLGRALASTFVRINRRAGSRKWKQLQRRCISYIQPQLQSRVFLEMQITSDYGRVDGRERDRRTSRGRWPGGVTRSHMPFAPASRRTY